MHSTGKEGRKGAEEGTAPRDLRNTATHRTGFTRLICWKCLDLRYFPDEYERGVEDDDMVFVTTLAFALKELLTSFHES